MGKRDSDLSVPEVDTKSENWNMSKGQVVLRLLKPLLEYRDCRIIARFGTVSVNDIPLDEETLAQKRVEGIERAVDILKDIWSSNKFAIPVNKRERYGEIKKKLDTIEKRMNTVRDFCRDELRKQTHIKIKEPEFALNLEALQSVMEDMSDMFNAEGLMFRKIDDFSFERLTDELVNIG